MNKTEICCKNIYKWRWNMMSDADRAKFAAAIRRINAEFSGATAKGESQAKTRVKCERAIKELKVM